MYAEFKNTASNIAELLAFVKGGAPKFLGSPDDDPNAHGSPNAAQKEQRATWVGKASALTLTP